MPSPKFDELDRERTKKVIEDKLNVTLTMDGPRRKAFVDRDGKPYWILGGYEDWHGIPPDLLQAGLQKYREGIFVIAKRTEQTIKVFLAPLSSLLRSRECLHQTKAGDFQFNIDQEGERLTIKEAPDITFQFLTEIEYPPQEKKKDKAITAIERSWAQLDKESREALLRQLGIDRT
jgi:hypothetical protein